MNSKNILASALVLGTVALSISSCSDDFLREKKNYGNFNQTTAYSDYNGAQERVNNLYYWMLPTSDSGDGNGTNKPNDWTPVGNPDKWSKSTEEFGGFSIFVNPGEEITYNFTTSNFDFFYVANDVYSPWGHIRNCNDVIENVEKSEAINEEQKKELLGQAYFFRAYMYYHLVTIYGGVPIVDHVQDPILGKDGDGSNLIIPRQTTKDCIDFICQDFQRAAEMLPARWTNDANDFGRITSGLAQAFLGKTLLYWASPVFNRADDATRWENAYVANKAALEKLQAGGFGLTYQGNSGINAANWARQWMDYTGSDGSVSEAVFITLHNTKDNVSGQPDYGKYNRWEHNIRPHNANGGGGYTPTAEMVDLFPMADGLKPGESSIAYDKLKFWLNRDPRFYRTFAFPGVQWQWSEGGVSLSDPSLVGIIPTDVYTTGRNYSLWSYMWNDNEEDLTKVTTTNGYWADLLTQTSDKGSSHSVYVRKRTDDLHLHSTPFYEYINSQSNPKGFMKSAAPLLAMRYAEVLLNYAEAACGAGHYDEALRALQQIRARVGYTAEKNYGLPSGIGSDRASLFAAILYERQIELAYEGNRYGDMHRWMLFDGGQGQGSIKPSWALTGFGGNTCSYLGVKPLNGTKRHQIVLYCTSVSATDPTTGLRPEALSLDEDMTYNNGVYNDEKVQKLAEFYQTYLARKDANLDGNDDALTIQYRPTYYFLGLRQNAMQTNPTLHQTVGWHDLGRNADGLFDPLSDTLP